MKLNHFKFFKRKTDDKISYAFSFLVYIVGEQLQF